VSAGASFGHAFVAVVAREGTKGHKPSSRCARGETVRAQYRNINEKVGH